MTFTLICTRSLYSSDVIQGFLLGIISSAFAAIILNYLTSNYYARFKYRKFLGKYKHPKGTVEIKHSKGDHFLAIGIENTGVKWISNLKYLDNSFFIGVYDWNQDSGLSDWGEHNLHVLPNGNISVIWTNKSVDKEDKGRLIWEKIK